MNETSDGLRNTLPLGLRPGPRLGRGPGYRHPQGAGGTALQDGLAGAEGPGDAAVASHRGGGPAGGLRVPRSESMSAPCLN